MHAKSEEDGKYKSISFVVCCFNCRMGNNSNFAFLDNENIARKTRNILGVLNSLTTKNNE